MTHPDPVDAETSRTAGAWLQRWLHRASPVLFIVFLASDLDRLATGPTVVFGLRVGLAETLRDVAPQLLL